MRKKANLLRHYVSNIRKKVKIDASSKAGIPIFEILLMFKARSTLHIEGVGGGKEGQGTEKEHFILKFSCPDLKYKFYLLKNSIRNT